MSNAPTISPLAMMRKQRPELFSDSDHGSEAILQKEILDHHLATLTKRKQEYQFEHFARLIVEQEICPNLRPQTGPTGGGDSKVDTETYPVASEIAERWYAADAEAHRQRWAFAISAKEKWEPKVKKDIEGIVGTGRNYDRIYFITSQYAPDKKRAALEDSLSRLHGVPVTILDRSWLLEKVTAGERSVRALEALGISPPQKAIVKLGPNDAARLRDLEDLDRKIEDSDLYRSGRYSLAEDMLSAALAARGLGRARMEVDGRFVTAARIAQDVGVRDQRFRIAYLHAWTTFWWFEDRATLDSMYDAVEALAVDSDLAGDVQKLLQLVQLMGDTSGESKDMAARIAGRLARLESRLKVMVENKARPNNAFHAQVVLATIELQKALKSSDNTAIDGVWKRLSSILGELSNQLNFSLEAMFELIQEMGNFVPDSAAYEALMDTFIDVIGRRRSEGAAGEANFQRGLQKLDREKTYDAIRLLGKAEIALAKDEHRQQHIRVLITLSLAYQSVGLLWAARTKLLLAIDQSCVVMRDEGYIPLSLLQALQRLVWIEIQLGRVPQILSAWTYFKAMLAQLDEETRSRFSADDQLELQDAALGILFLLMNGSQIQHLTCLPDVLGNLGLPLSRTATLWALGHGDNSFGEGKPPSDWDAEAFVKRWMQQPILGDLPRQSDLGDQAVAHMTSRFLGLRVAMRAPRNLMSLAVAEAVLSALEAFFATSLDRKIVPWREEVRFEVAASDTAQSFSVSWTESDLELTVRIEHPSENALDGETKRKAFNQWLFDLIAETIGRTLIIRNAKLWLRQVAGEEQAFSRAITLGNVPVLSKNLYGVAPRLRLQDWHEMTATSYPRLGEQVWSEEVAAELKVAREQLAKDFNIEDFEAERLRHSDRRISTIINFPLWERAGWTGTGSLVTEGGGPVVLGLAYRNTELGRQIFEGWCSRFGESDEEEVIRVAIIRGVNRKNPAEYAVTIGRSLVLENDDQPGLHFLSMTRINRMYPGTSKNIERFINAFEREGSYYLVPMKMRAGGVASVNDFSLDLGIRKSRLEIRNAWEIGPNDVDAIAIYGTDDPFLPEGQRDAPVLETIAQAKNVKSFFDDDE